MESCFDKWMDFIKQKRKKYHHLNYFTTDQLVILQRELVKIGTNEEPSHLIYPLLSAVKSECTKCMIYFFIFIAFAFIYFHLEMVKVLNTFTIYLYLQIYMHIG